MTPKYILTAPAGDDPIARTLGQDTVRVSVYDVDDLRQRVVAAWATDTKVRVELTPEYVARAARYSRAERALVLVIVAAVGLVWWAETAGHAALMVSAAVGAFASMVGSVVCGHRAELPDCDELVADTLADMQ